MSTLTRPRAAAIGVALALAGGFVAPTMAAAAEAPPVLAPDVIQLDHGHIDAFNLDLNSDASIRLALKEDVTGSHVVRAPESTTLVVRSQASVRNAPTGALPAGMPSDFSLLPLTQDPDLIWPGWDTQTIGSVYGSDARVDIAITDVQGPGDAYLWTQGSFGVPAPLLTQGYRLPGTIHQEALAHAHANWGFSAPGIYTLTAQAVATSRDGSRTSTSNAATYTFDVLPAPTGLTVAGAEGAVTPGSPVTLTASQQPSNASFADYTWYTRANPQGAWKSVAGAYDATLTVDAVDGAQYKARVSGGQDLATGDALTAESEPVTLSAASTPGVTLAIQPLADHYHSGTTIDVSAVAAPGAPSGSTYRWSLQRSDQSASTRLGGTAATAHLTAEQALDGAAVTAELLDSSGAVLATSAATPIHVDDHGAGPLQKITIRGLDDTYDEGDTVSLEATVKPESVLSRYEWSVQRVGEAVPTRVAGANASTYSFTATAEDAGAAVIAKLTYDDGRAYVESPAVIVQVTGSEQEIPLTELTISTSRAPDDYWVGQTATLTAQQSPATGLTGYRWFAKAPGASDFTVVPGQTATDYAFKPTLANSGVQVKVQLLRGTAVHAESAPVTITTRQRDVATTLLVSADKAEYVAGDTATFTSRQEPATDHAHYHWYVKKAGSADFVWVDQSREAGLSYPVTREDDGAQLVLRLFDETHATIAQSDPFTLRVTGGETGPGTGTTLAIEGLRAGYAVGETAVLDAVATPATDEDHYHWFVKRAGDADYSVISGATASRHEHVVRAEDRGASIIARLYDHDHALIAESEPVTLTVAAGAAKPTGSPATPSESALDGSAAGGITASLATASAGSVVTLQVGADRAGSWVSAWLFSTPMLLGGDWLQVSPAGSVAVTIPADAALGSHRIAVFDADGALVGWQPLEIATVANAKAAAATAADRLAATGSADLSTLTAGALMLVLAGAVTTVIARRRRGPAL
jgi:surface-anchored protein